MTTRSHRELQRKVTQRAGLTCAVPNVLQVEANPDDWEGYGPLPPEPSGEDTYKEGVARGHWDLRLTSFQKLMFIKSFQEEMVSATNSFCTFQ